MWVLRVRSFDAVFSGLGACVVLFMVVGQLVVT